MNGESSGSALIFICSGFGVSREDEAQERDDDEREEEGREDSVERGEDGVVHGAHWAGGGIQSRGGRRRQERPAVRDVVHHELDCVPGHVPERLAPADVLVHRRATGAVPAVVVLLIARWNAASYRP